MSFYTISYFYSFDLDILPFLLFNYFITFFHLIEDVSFDQMQPIFMDFLKNILAKPRAIT